MENYNTKKNDHMALLFAITAFLLGAALPASSFLLNVALGLSLICVLLNRDFKQIRNVLKNPLVLIPAFIFIAYLVSSLIMQNDYGLNLTGKYRKLLYPIILIPFFLYNRDLLDKFFQGFQAANAIIAVINVIAFTFNHVTGEQFPLPMNFFKEYLTQSFFFAISAFIWLIKANSQTNLQTKRIYITLALLTCFNILFILPGRIGFLALLTSTAVYIILNANVKHLIIALTLIIASSFIMVSTQNRIITRTMEGVTEIKHYVESLDQPSAKDLDNTSMGFRIGIAHKAVEMIKNAPILGNGAGSFLYKTSSRNPHNEYLFMTVQFGIIGLLVFLFWLYKYYAIAWQQLPVWRNIFFIIASAYVAGCFFNSFLLDLSEGTFFIISNSALASLVLQKQNTRFDKTAYVFIKE